MTLVTAVQLLSPSERLTMLANNVGNIVYVGMPGNAARAYGLTDDLVGPFGKPWACLKDPRGWQVAYREYLHDRIMADPDFALAVRDLHGKTLVCWCHAKGPGTICHGDTLAAAANWLFEAMGAATPIA